MLKAKVDVAYAWTNYACLPLRIDKCITFGLAKLSGSYSQFKPNIYIDSKLIPSIKIGDSFKNLGKLFDAAMDNQNIKSSLKQRVSEIAKRIGSLKINVHLKLKILFCLPSQICFQLHHYDLSVTWIETTLIFLLLILSEIG